MIIQTMYFNGNTLDCATIEATDKGRLMFKAYDTEEQATEKAEQWREVIGQNIARVITSA